LLSLSLSLSIVEDAVHVEIAEGETIRLDDGLHPVRRCRSDAP
jgi:hypothetical protein